VRRTLPFKNFINHSFIGLNVYYQLREGRRLGLLTELSSWLLPCLSALSHSAFTTHSYEVFHMLFIRGLRGAV